jgi:hypothetical protein
MTKRTRYFVFGSLTVLLVGLCTGLVAYYTGMPMGAFGQTDGPAELRYVPGSAAIVAYADVRNLMNSELRQKLQPTMEDEEDGQAEFKRETGIDIEHDIDRVVAYMEPGAGGEHVGMVIATGRFDQGRLEALALEHGGTVENYRGKRLISKSGFDGHHGNDDGDEDAADQAPERDEHGHVARVPKSMTVAFLEPGLVAVGETAAVKAAVDREGGSSVLANTELMNLVKDVDDSNAWAVGRFDALLANAKLPQEMASRIPAVRLFSASGHINGGVSGLIRAEARDDQSAQNLRDVVQGFLALARMQTGSQPEMQMLMNSLQLSGTGTTVALSFQLPTQVLESLAAAKRLAEEE